MATTQVLLEDYYCILDEIEELKYSIHIEKDEETLKDLNEEMKTLQNDLKETGDALLSKSTGLHKAMLWKSSQEAEIKGTIDSVQAELKRLKKRLDNIKRTNDFFNKLLYDITLAKGKEHKGKMTLEIETMKLTLSETPGKLVMEEGAEAPERYIKVKTVESIDKVGIKKAIKNGVDIAGFSIVKEPICRIS